MYGLRGYVARQSRMSKVFDMTLDLVFTRFDLCDGCQAQLEPEAKLWGLCPACYLKSGISRVPIQGRKTPKQKED